MEEERMDAPETEQPRQGYKPRPAWQIWAARIGLVIVIIGVIFTIITLPQGADNADPGN